MRDNRDGVCGIKWQHVSGVFLFWTLNFRACESDPFRPICALPAYFIFGGFLLNHLAIASAILETALATITVSPYHRARIFPKPVL